MEGWGHSAGEQQGWRPEPQPGLRPRESLLRDMTPEGVCVAGASLTVSPFQAHLGLGSTHLSLWPIK